MAGGLVPTVTYVFVYLGRLALIITHIFLYCGTDNYLSIYSYVLVLIFTYRTCISYIASSPDDTLVAGWYLLLPKYSQKSKYIATLQSQYTRTLTFQNFSLAAPQRLDQNATGVLDVRLTAIDVIRRLALRGDRPVLGALMTFKNSLSGTPQEERLYSAVVEVSCFLVITDTHTTYCGLPISRCRIMICAGM